MIDRKAKVTQLKDGRFKIEGVAYIANKPNVNNVIYTKKALEEAFERFMKENFRPITIGCGVNPTLESCVGHIVSYSVNNDIFSVVTETLPLKNISNWINENKDIAFAGACMVDELSENGIIDSISRIISFGLVSVDEVVDSVPEKK